MSSWSLYDANTTTQIANNYQWSADGGVLRAGLGKGMERQYPFTDSVFTGMFSPNKRYALFEPFPDSGYGTNGVSPYKSLTSVTSSMPLLVPPTPTTGYISPSTALSPVDTTFMRSNKKYFYFTSGSYLWAWNKSKIPTYSSGTGNDGGFFTNYWLVHHWTNGVNPYDFILPLNGMPSGLPSTITVPYFTQSDMAAYPNYWQEANAGNFTHASSTTQVLMSPPYQSNTWSTEISDRTIYRVTNASTYSYAYYYAGQVPPNCGDYGCDPPSIEPAGSAAHLIIAAYDAYTGAYIGMNADMALPNGTTLKLTTKGDHLIAYGLDGATLTYVEYDRNGNVITNGSQVFQNSSSGTYSMKHKNYFGTLLTDQPRVYNCYGAGVDTDSLAKDDKGNLYFYSSVACKSQYVDPFTHSSYYLDPYFNPEAPSGLYLMKFDISSFTTQSLGRLGGVDTSYTSTGFMASTSDNHSMIYINSFTRQAYTRTFHTYWQGGSGYNDKYYNTVGLDGQGVWGGPGITQYPYYTGFHIDHSGGTPTPWCTPTASGGCDRINNHSHVDLRHEWGYMHDYEYYADSYAFGQYFGDGFWVSAYNQNDAGNGQFSGYGLSGHYVFLDIGPVDTNEAYKGFHLGQYVSTDTSNDSQFTFSLQMDDPTNESTLAGFSFRMQDPQNRFAVETDGSTLYLSRYIGGGRVVLASQPYAFDNSTYNFKIKTLGDQIDVWMNDIPVFHDIHDGTFLSGKFGPFTDKSNVGFSGISNKIVVDLSQWLTGYAILDAGQAVANVQYPAINFTDPENDPMAGNFQWSISHTPKFINNTGYSIYNGVTLTAPQTTFDKVGVYSITLRARDDPQPDYLWPSMVFDGYRRNSNPFTNKLIVHRRPIAQVTAVANPDGTISYINDTSYDPDRYDPVTGQVSPPENGKDYSVHHGIFEHKYWYQDPNGNYVNAKLARVKLAGNYTIYMAVRDEYGAWSYPISQVIYSNGGAVQDNPPVAQLTNPTGTLSAPTLQWSVRPTMTWHQTDADANTIFKAFHVVITDLSGSIVADSGEVPIWTNLNDWSWPVPIDLNMGQEYGVQVAVSDGELFSSWSTMKYMVINGPPKILVTDPPETTSQSAPKIYQTPRPTISLLQMDAQNQVLQYYRILAYRPDGSVVYDKTFWDGMGPGAFQFTFDQDLPADVPLKINAYVYDGGLWSPVSNDSWLQVNNAPYAWLTFPVGTIANPDHGNPTPLIQWGQGDSDPNVLYTKYQVVITNSSGTTTYVDTGWLDENTTSSTGQHQVTAPLPSGIIVKVTVRVQDQYGAVSPWAPAQYMLTNRPPTGNITFATPIYEHDTPTFNVGVSDPDGNALGVKVDVSFNGGTFTNVVSWSNVASGSTKTFTYGPLNLGGYTLRLSVDDGFGGTYTQTYTFTSLPLSVTGQVTHTPQWEANRQNWNLMFPSKSRDANVFWAGERFVLSAETTVTGTATTATQVDVSIPGIGTTTLIEDSSNPGMWNGYIGTDNSITDLGKLADGVYDVTFTAYYSNGAIKTDIVSIQILNVWTDYFSLHRRY